VNDTLRKIIEDTLLLASNTEDDQTQSALVDLATRLCAYEAVRGGFGASADDYRKPDPAGPIRLVLLCL